MVFLSKETSELFSKELSGCSEGMKDLVPVFFGGTPTLDERMEVDHDLSDVIAGTVGIKSAKNAHTLFDQSGKPGWIGPGSRGGYAARLGMESPTTDRIDGRFAKNDFNGIDGADCKIAHVFA